MQPDLKRDLLGAIGLGLEDEAYVLVVAGMGVSYRPWSTSHGVSQQFVTWTPHKFLTELKRLGERPHDTSVLVEYQNNWRDHLGRSNKRAFLLEDEFDAETPELIAIVKLLNHSASLLTSVTIEKNAPQGDLRWNWPLRVAALPNDFQTLGLEKLRAT